MPVPETQINYISDQMEPVGGVTFRKMFGGVGIFKEGKMFGMLNSKGTLFMKVDATNIQDYQDRDMLPFSHDKNKTAKMPYYEVPLEIIEDRNLLKVWADKSTLINSKPK